MDACNNSAMCQSFGEQTSDDIDRCYVSCQKQITCRMQSVEEGLPLRIAIYASANLKSTAINYRMYTDESDKCQSDLQRLPEDSQQLPWHQWKRTAHVRDSPDPALPTDLQIYHQSWTSGSHHQRQEALPPHWHACPIAMTTHRTLHLWKRKTRNSARAGQLAGKYSGLDLKKISDKHVRRYARKNFNRNVRQYVRKECQKICQKRMSEDMSERMSEDMLEKVVRRYVRKGCQKICQKICQTRISEDTSEKDIGRYIRKYVSQEIQ